MLDVTSNDKGFLPPRLTILQRDAITDKPEGLTIYNTDLKCMQYWNSIEWKGNCTANPPQGSVTSIDCANAINFGELVEGTPVTNVSTSIPYLGGNGGYYDDQSVTSTGVTGLTAELVSGNFAMGSGSLYYTITGTPSTSGLANFIINIGGKTCTLTRIVTSACSPVSGSGIINPISGTMGVGSTVTFTIDQITNASAYEWYVNGTLQSGQTGSSFSYTPSVAGSVVIGVRGLGCNSSVTSLYTSNINVTPACSPVSGSGTITPNSGTMTVGSSTTFTVSGITNASAYEWYVNGTLQSGQTGSSFSYTPSVTGSVVIGVRGLGCNSSSTSIFSTSTFNVTPACAPASGSGIISPSSGSNLTGNTSISFSISGISGATSYKWEVLKGGSVVHVETTSTPSINITFKLSGAVSIRVTGLSECTGTEVVTVGNYTVSGFSSGTCVTAGRFITPGTNNGYYICVVDPETSQLVKYPGNPLYTCASPSYFSPMQQQCVFSGSDVPIALY
jgi:hypothetical protein